MDPERVVPSELATQPIGLDVLMARVVISDWKADCDHRRHSSLGYHALVAYVAARTYR